MGINNDLKEKIELLNYLIEFISENKKSKFDEIIKYRTKYLTVVLEDIYQSQNASAVLRSCDCFGIQDVHIIENRNKYNVNPEVALGSSKWLNLKKHNSEKNNTLSCIKSLKKQGYKIVATTPHKNDCKLENLKIDNKIAIFFGTELKGLSDIAINNADEFVKIPMYGFTESFNISVSAALAIFYLSEKIKKSDLNWELNEMETIDTKLSWVKSVIKCSDLIEKNFLKNKR